MTLADLVNKARDCGMPFTTWSIPLLKDGKPFDIEFEAEGSNDGGGWHINIVEKWTQEELDNIQDIYKAALDLVECVEKYVRQETNRSTLIWRKEKLKRLLEK